MAYSNLRFYDSDANDLNLVYDIESDLLKGVVYLPLVSTGLYETLTLHVLENVEAPLSEDLHVTPIAEVTGEVQFRFRFNNDYNSSQDIFLYGANQENGDLIIRKDKQQTVDILPKSSSPGVSQSGVKLITSSLKPKPVSAQIALTSEVEGFHIRPLAIYEVVDGIETRQIAEIKIYGEVEEEDERLKVLLSNMGMRLEDLDYFIFKDADINELSPDNILLNQKRKELLLQASQIEPFIGTYKALLNAIDFFGYDKITLKEYWLNINQQSENFGKLKAIAVPNQDVIGFLADKNKSNNLPNSNQKKTSRFSLVYRLNAPTGELDYWDIPKVKETLDYSPDEVLIKLYGLKNKLQKNYLPLQAKIVDITGEGDYFSQFNINTWNNQHSIKDQNAGIEFKPVKVPAYRDIFMEDLRKVDHRLTGYGQDFDAIPHDDKLEICDSIDNFYTKYYDESKDTFNTIDGIPIGAPIALHIEEGLEDTWEFADFTWEDSTDAGDHFLTWENWWHRGVYEIEWQIYGPRGYNKSFRGPVYEYDHFPLTLPYVGEYTIESHLHDLYNVRSTKIHKKWVEVKNKNVEIYGLTQYAGEEKSWSEYDVEWQRAGSSWGWSRENLTPVRDIIGTFYLTMDRANYIYDEDEVGENFSIVRRYLDPSQPSGFAETTGPYQWDQLVNHTWSDGPDVTWKMTRVGPDLNSSFQIVLHTGNSGGTIIIEQDNPITDEFTQNSYEIQGTYPANTGDINAYLNIANELQNLDSEQYPIFNKFNFNAILVDQDGNLNTGAGTLGEDVCPYILAVAKEPSRSFDFSDARIETSSEGYIANPVHFVSYNPGFDDTYIINGLADIHMLNHVTFSYDLTNMPGIVSQKWRVVNNTLNVNDIYYSNPVLTQLFRNKGYHSVELELMDSNGNKNKVTKNILNII